MFISAAARFICCSSSLVVCPRAPCQLTATAGYSQQVCTNQSTKTKKYHGSNVQCVCLMSVFMIFYVANIILFQTCFSLQDGSLKVAQVQSSRSRRRRQRRQVCSIRNAAEPLLHSCSLVAPYLWMLLDSRKGRIYNI